MQPKRLNRLYAELGAKEATLYLLGRMLRYVSCGRIRMVRYLFVAQPVPRSQDAVRPAGAVQKSSIRQIYADDPIVTCFPRPPHVIARRFASGHMCFVAESNGRFAGYLWLARKHYQEDEVRCLYRLAPAEHCAWDYDVYVEPAFRMGRTFARLWSAANDHLAKEGVYWSLSRISTFNPASLAAHRRFCLKELATALFIVAGSFQLSVFSIRPYFHATFKRDAFPEITLSPEANPPR